MKRSIQFIRKLFVLSLLFVLLFVGASSVNLKVNAASTATFSISNTVTSKTLRYGVTYRSVEGMSSTGGSNTLVRQVCNVVEIPSVEGLVVTTWADISPSKWNMSHVNAVAKKYEAAHPGYKVIAATNGDFYDINANNNFPRTPTGCEISDGNYFKSIPTRSTNYQVVSFTNDGSKNSIKAYNQNVVKVNSTPTLGIFDENDELVASFVIDKVNAAPGAGEISVFYGTYDGNKAFVPQEVIGDSAATFVVGKALYCLPHSSNDFYGLGVISGSSADSTTNQSFVIKSNNDVVNAKLQKGVKIRVQYEWNGEAAGVKDAVNAGTQVLVNGSIAGNANSGDGSRMSARHPRTAVGVKDNGAIVLMVNDGRQESIGRYGSYGDELAAMMQAFGCVDAFNLDGGGSSIMYYLDGDELVLGNKYSDASERSISNIVLVAIKEPDIEVNFKEIGSRTVDVEVSVKDAGRHNIKELIVEAGGREATVTNGSARISGLSQLTRYDLRIVYVSANGRKVYTTLLFPFATTAKEYKITGFNVSKNGDNYNVELAFSDLGESTNLATAKIKINGKEYQLTDGKVVIPVSDFDVIHELLVIVDVKTIDGVTTTTLYNPHAPFLNDMKESFNSYQDLLNSIYK